MNRNLEPVAGTGQRWEQLVSPGHVLAARVNALHAIVPLLALSALLLLGLLCGAFVASEYLRAKASKAAVAIARMIAPRELNGSLSRISPPQPQVPAIQPDAYAQMVETNEAAAWLVAQTQVVARAKTLPNCKKLDITSPWPIDGTLGCRQSEDKKRLWVWGVTRNPLGQGIIPLFGIYRLGAWSTPAESRWDIRLLNVGYQVPGSIAVLEPSQVRIALSSDFPELGVKQ